MLHPSSCSRARSGEQGFTLLEALVALSIIALVVMNCLMFRTGALVDATEARNWRVAREVAQEILSELKAGARSEPPQYNMERTPIPSMRDVRGWSYQIVIGQDRIASLEGDLEANSADADSDDRSRQRREFQAERDDLRKARQSGMSFYEYREKSQMEERDRLEREDVPPSEDEFEECAVFVFFPNPRQASGVGGEFSHFVLKARVSTLALEGLTPEEAETLNGESGEGGAASAGSTGDGK